MIREFLRGAGNMVIAGLPRNRLLYRVCSRYVDQYNGENNPDALANGEFALLRAQLPASRTVFDVGANVGDWASLALSVNPGIELHCFEPSPSTFRHLRSKQFPPNVTLNNVGLGASEKQAELFLFGEAAGTNSLYAREGLGEHGIAGPTGRESVRLTSIDRYCEEHRIREIDFLKLDVEGHEFEALKGAITMLRGEQIKVIQFEFGGTSIDARVFLKDIWSLFDKLHYGFFKLFPEGPRPYRAYSQTLERFQYQNWAVVRDDVAI